MSILNQENDRSLSLQYLRDARALCFVLVVAFLTYWSELSQFTLSIDEEVYSFTVDTWRGWAQQGRWGMAALCYLLPPFSAIPFLSPLIFLAGLVTSSLLVAPIFCRTREEAIVFSSFMVSSPLWLHVAEFNTLSWGVGIALLASSFAIIALQGKARWGFVYSGLLLGFTISVYQTLVLNYLIIVVALLLSKQASFRGHSSPEKKHLCWRLGVKACLSLGIAGAFYLAMQWLVVSIFHLQIEYVQDWIKIDQFFSAPQETISKTADRMLGLVIGSDPSFLGWGAACLLLPWLGVVLGLWETLLGRGISIGERAWRFLALLIVGTIIFIPIIISAGMVPSRALTAFPLVYAILAASAFRVSFQYVQFIPQKAIFLYAIFVHIWIASSLFYSDHLARSRDLALGTRLLLRIEDATQETLAPVPFVLIGGWAHKASMVAKRVEIFGSSFFEHNGGNAWRVSMYLSLLGGPNLQPVPISQLSMESRTAVLQMPLWPHPDSIVKLDGVLIMKLGEATLAQDSALKALPDPTDVKNTR